MFIMIYHHIILGNKLVIAEWLYCLHLPWYQTADNGEPFHVTPASLLFQQEPTCCTQSLDMWYDESDLQWSSLSNTCQHR